MTSRPRRQPGQPGGRATIEAYEREAVRLQQAKDPAMRAQGRLRSAIGRQVIDFSIAEREQGRDGDDILADLMRFAAIEHGTASSISGLTEAQTRARADVAVSAYVEWMMWGWRAGENHKQQMRGVVDMTPSSPKTLARPGLGAPRGLPAKAGIPAGESRGANKTSRAKKKEATHG